MPDTWDSLVDTDILGPCMDVFGTTCTYTSAKTGAVMVISAVFDQQYLSLAAMGSGPFGSTEAFSIGAPGSITTAKPVIGVQLSQFAIQPAQGDTFTVQPPGGGDLLNFIVKEVQADGHGAAKLMLKLNR